MNKIVINRFEIEDGFDKLEESKFVYLDFYSKYLKLVNLYLEDEEIREDFEENDMYYVGLVLSKNLKEGILRIRVGDTCFAFLLKAVTNMPMCGSMVYEFEEVIDD